MRRANTRVLIQDSLDEKAGCVDAMCEKRIQAGEIFKFSYHATQRLKERYDKDTNVIKNISDAHKHRAILTRDEEGDLKVITFLPMCRKTILSIAREKSRALAAEQFKREKQRINEEKKTVMTWEALRLSAKALAALAKQPKKIVKVVGAYKKLFSRGWTPTIIYGPETTVVWNRSVHTPLLPLEWD